MKKVILCLGVIITIIITLSFSTVYAQTNSPSLKTWASYFEKAKTQKKLVILYFYSKDCGYCQRMSSTTLTDPAVSNLLRTKYILVKIDYFKHQTLAEEFNISGTPTFVIMDSAYHTIGRTTGYMPPDEFISKLKHF